MKIQMILNNATSTSSVSLVPVFYLTLFWKKLTIAILPHEPNGNNGTNQGRNNRISGDRRKTGLARPVFLDKQLSYRTLSNKSRRLQDITILMFKVRHRLCTAHLNFLGCQSLPSLDLRPRSLANILSPISGPKLWNGLPGEIGSQSSLDSFKNRIRKCDLSLIVQDNNCLNCILCNS